MPKHRTKPGGTCCFQSLSPQQFQALFNSLFKVLFIFPSRYLFAIGLLLIFSFRWYLPPTLGCTRKQPDSLARRRTALHWACTGLAPSTASHSMEVIPVRCTGAKPIDYNSPEGDLKFELLPVHSPLLRQSLLVSFPPLSNMLKSSGSSCLISGRVKKGGASERGPRGEARGIRRRGPWGCRAAVKPPSRRSCSRCVKIARAGLTWGN